MTRPSKHHPEYPDLLFNIMQPLADTVTPVSCINMGLFLSGPAWIYWKEQQSFNQRIRVIICSIVLVIGKLFLFPLLALLILKIGGMEGITARCVLIVSSLPLSMQAYAFSTKYEIFYYYN